MLKRGGTSAACYAAKSLSRLVCPARGAAALPSAQALPHSRGRARGSKHPGNMFATPTHRIYTAFRFTVQTSVRVHLNSHEPGHDEP
jgi:hypothetical protein